MTQYLSDKLKVLSFFSILLVLYIHSGFHANELADMTLNDKVQEFISGMLGRCAVPLFYIISGYLFFLKVPDGIYSIYEKMRKRVRTLLTPYIIASVFFVAFGVLVSVTPGISQFVNSSSMLPLFHESISQILVSIFYNAGNGAPIAFQLWFLRDLIIIIAFAPVLYILLKHLKWIFILIVFILNFITIKYVPIYALFWFSLGGVFANSNIYRERKKSNLLIMILFFIIVSFLQLFTPNEIIWEYLKIPIILTGILCIWQCYDIIVPKSFNLKEHKYITTACQFTFFIYLFHEPTINVVRKLIVYALGKNSMGYLISYLLSPWIFAVIAIYIGLLLRKYIPKIYSITVGGR